MSDKPDFWYILGHDYEVTVFATEEAAWVELGAMADDQRSYYRLFEGRFGEEFSGWIGRHE